jgi:nucleoside-diphosphate-sugar epimerase
MRLLVLGGTAFAGRAVVEDALARGWSVTTFSRGVTGPAPAGAEALHGDREAAGDLRALAGRTWDAVVDTWRGSADAVRESVRQLRGSAGAYAYVSSLAALRWPPPPAFTESAPLVDDEPATPGDPYAEYAAAKAAAERAVAEAFGPAALCARAGLLLGPHEYAGRLPWWLLRMRRGGPVLAPAPAGAQVQYVDVRDLATWVLDRLEAGLGGAFNTLCPRGHATMGGLLEACRDAVGTGAELVWVEGRFALEAGVVPWTELPIWLPADDFLGPSYDADPSAAAAAGLRCRPLAATVAATWEWLRGLDGAEAAARAGQRKPWLAPEKEAAVLAAWRSAAGVGHQSG